MDGQAQTDRLRVRVGCEFVYSLAWPVPVVIQVEVRDDGDWAILAESFTSEPNTDSRTYIDPFGNRCRRMTLQPGTVRLRYEAEALIDPSPDPVDTGAGQHDVADLPDEVLPFTLPSRHCESDVLAASAWPLFGGVEGGWARAQAVTDWVHYNVTFAHQSSDSTTSATDVFLRRRGVCRDFAHLAIAFMRALNIPARYCYGYLPDIDVTPTEQPMDFVAWLEAYVGGAWHTFDPRNNSRRIGRVLVGRGRDAVDVAEVTSYGGAPLVAMRVVAEDAASPPWASAGLPVYGMFRP